MEKLSRFIFKAFQELFSTSSRPTVRGVQPYIKNSRNKGLIKYWWSAVFYDNDNLRMLANDCPLHPRQDYGLMYCYIVDGQLRYIGQTRERSLKWRMTRRQMDLSVKEVGSQWLF